MVPVLVDKRRRSSSGDENSARSGRDGWWDQWNRVGGALNSGSSNGGHGGEGEVLWQSVEGTGKSVTCWWEKWSVATVLRVQIEVLVLVEEVDSP